MEYDRSLYRVYERVMDDLNSSAPISEENNNNENLLPLFIPMSIHEFINRNLRGRHLHYMTLPQFNRGRNDQQTDNDTSIELTNIQRNSNPLYSHHSRRMQIRMGEHRRAFAVNDSPIHRNIGNGTEAIHQNSEESQVSSDNQNNHNIHIDLSMSESSSESSSSYNSYSSSQSELNAIVSDNTNQDERQLQRLRRERRMRRRQARIDEPLEDTLRRIRNRARNRGENGNNASDETGGCSKKNLYWFMQFSMVCGIFHVFVLYVLHYTYVGAGVWKQGIFQWGNYNKPLSLTNRPQTCLEYALETRPAPERSSYGEAHNKAYANLTEEEILLRRPLLGLDEILQIKIIHGGTCNGRCSRVHNVIANDSDANSSSEAKESKPTSILDNILHSKDSQSISLDPSTIEYYSTTEFWETPHYRYTSMEAVMFLDKTFELEHKLSVVNVTLTERCLSAGSDEKKPTFLTKVSEVFSQAYGEDTAIINQLMYGIRELPPLYTDDDDGDGDGEEEGNSLKRKKEEETSIEDNYMMYRNGYIQNLESEERWNWNKDMLELADERTPMYWLFDRLGILFASSLSFFLITSVTAVIVRVLTGSGVVLMFPIFYVFRLFGIQGVDYRILGLSYPWIGRPLDAMHRQNINPASHLIWAHLGKIMLYYVMYEACQATWSSVLYGKSIPATMPIWIFGMAMFWEYFTMVFVRSALSVYFFPRIALLYYTCFHIYFYSVPYGYFDVALIPLFFLMLQAMLYTILALEMPAASRGVVSMECPREVYSRLSWPEWTASLPVEWTLFLPLNSRYIPLHDRAIDVEGVVSDDSSNDTNSGDDSIGEESGDIEIDGEVIVEEVDIQNVSTNNDRPGLHARRIGSYDRHDIDGNVYGTV